MSSYISVASYFDGLRRYYLRDFISSGGSTVRAALGNKIVRDDLKTAVEKDSIANQFVYATIDSSEVRLQQLHDVFFQVSRNIHWESLSRRWVRTVLGARFDIDEADLTLNGMLRKASTQEPYIVRRRLDEVITEKILRRPGMSNEFRRAMHQLIGTVLEPNSINAGATPDVLRWLKGELDRLIFVKPALIYRKITKTNARSMLTSLSRWVRDCGFAGLVITIDLASVTLPPKLAVGHKYSKAAAMDIYEVIRQFIDALEDVEGLAVIILAEEDFADSETRGTKIYPALRMRLSDDVWDANRANALAPMVRLA